MTTKNNNENVDNNVVFDDEFYDGLYEITIKYDLKTKLYTVKHMDTVVEWYNLEDALEYFFRTKANLSSSFAIY